MSREPALFYVSSRASHNGLQRQVPEAISRSSQISVGHISPSRVLPSCKNYFNFAHLIVTFLFYANLTIEVREFFHYTQQCYFRQKTPLGKVKISEGSIYSQQLSKLIFFILIQVISKKIFSQNRVPITA